MRLDREEYELELRVWFVYRYLYKNPYKLNNEKIVSFFNELDNFFKEKYTKIMGTREEAIKEIMYLFQFDSEQVQIIDEMSILELIERYKECQHLLNSKDTF